MSRDRQYNASMNFSDLIDSLTESCKTATSPFDELTAVQKLNNIVHCHLDIHFECVKSDCRGDLRMAEEQIAIAEKSAAEKEKELHALTLEVNIVKSDIKKLRSAAVLLTFICLIIGALSTAIVYENF